MEYRYQPPNAEYYATALQWDAKKKLLYWTGGHGQDALIVQTLFGTNPMHRMERVCQELGQTELPFNHFYRLSEETEVCFVSARDAVLGCRGNGEACTYTVFPCSVEDTRDGRICQVFAQDERGSISSPICDVPLSVRVFVEQDTRKAGFFVKRDIPTGFYHIRFLDSCDSRYQNGFLEYRVGTYQIPITRSMFEKRDIYVHTDIEPIIVSSTPCVVLQE